MNQKTITLPCHNMVVVLLDEELHALTPSRWGGGSITSEAKEVCEHCKDPNCDMDCPEYKEYASDRDTDIVAQKLEERTVFQKDRIAIDVIESIVLAHAIAGIDIETPAYIEGIETALDALENNT